MTTTRFAPSPTGDPHIGNIRTALFAYLLAKHSGGKFLLRIEDTDRKRQDDASIDTIFDALKWLGIAPDNIDNPMIQSKRLEIYKKEAFRLVEEGKAYICNCTPEELKISREEMIKAGKAPMYSGKCRDLKLEIKDSKLPDNAVIRMKVPKGEKISFTDAVRGKIEFDSDTIDDQIILKSDGYPTYHLAHVIDDHEMGVTDIIRSEEWLSSTPKHIILNKMLGFEAPNYAHPPVILSPNKGKLSKRDGAIGILEYRKLGYLPEALINFMVFLGWNPKDEREFFTLAELEKEFDLKNINKAGAVFDIEKLNYYNRHYLQEKPEGEVATLIDQNVLKKFSAFDREKIVALAKDRMEKLSDFEKTVSFLLEEKITPNILVFKKSDKVKTVTGLKATSEKIEAIEDFNAQNIKSALEKAVEQNKLSNGDVFWPVRVALSGLEKSPPPEQIAEVLGKEETLSRISRAIQIINTQ
jgi:glutamyl-tRNA synthetase